MLLQLGKGHPPVLAYELANTVKAFLGEDDHKLKNIIRVDRDDCFDYK